MACAGLTPTSEKKLYAQEAEAGRLWNASGTRRNRTHGNPSSSALRLVPKLAQLNQAVGYLFPSAVLFIHRMATVSKASKATTLRMSMLPITLSIIESYA
jgi:hypothetical protein